MRNRTFRAMPLCGQPRVFARAAGGGGLAAGACGTAGADDPASGGSGETASAPGRGCSGRGGACADSAGTALRPGDVRVIYETAKRAA